MRSTLRLILPLVLTAAASGQLKDSPLAPAKPSIYDSVVKIECATQVPDYRTPWNSGRFSGGRGTGFLIGPNQFLTNAHVVSDARRLLITRRGSAPKHVADLPSLAKALAATTENGIHEIETDQSPYKLYLDQGLSDQVDAQFKARGLPSLSRLYEPRAN